MRTYINIHRYNTHLGPPCGAAGVQEQRYILGLRCIRHTPLALSREL